MWRFCAVDLVLDEVVGLVDLADVVVVRRHAAEQRVRPDRLGRRFGERRDLQAVVVSARRFDREAPQQRLARIRQFQQRHARRDAERLFDERQDAQHDEPDRQPRRAAVEAVAR